MLSHIFSFKTLFIFLLSTFLFASVVTYYSYLSQYSTPDQISHLPNIKAFVDHPTSIDYIKEQYGATFVFVGIPGMKIDHYLSSHYKLYDKIGADIYYTPLLAYAFMSVNISLLLLAYIIILIGKVAKLKPKKDHILYLLVAIVLINFPMLKGMAKIMKYDSLSILFSALAALSYIQYKQNNKVFYLAQAFACSAIAMLEKISCFTVPFVLFLFELFYLFDAFIYSPSIKKELKQFVYCLLIIITSFFGTVYIIVPATWFHPEKVFSVFDGLSFFFGKMKHPLPFIIIMIAFLTVLLMITRGLREKIKKITTKINYKTILYCTAAFVIILFISALVYQKCDMVYLNTAEPSFMNKIKTENLIVSPTMAEDSFSTLDKNLWLTRAKVFFNNFRLIVYFLPEIVVIFFILSPFLIAIDKEKKIFFKDKYAFLVLLGFALINLLGNAYMLAIVHSKYVVIILSMCLLFSIIIMIRSLQYLNLKNVTWFYTGAAIITLLMLKPAFQAYPTYQGYMNIFRSAGVENTDFLSCNYLTSWTHTGFGETSFYMYKYLEKEKGAPQNIFCDYDPPFYKEKKYEGAEYDPRLLMDIKKAGIDYFQIDKIRAYRIRSSASIVKRFRSKAAYIYKVGDFEYGWLFKIDDIINDLIIKNNTFKFLDVNDDKTGSSAAVKDNINDMHFTMQIDLKDTVNITSVSITSDKNSSWSTLQGKGWLCSLYSYGKQVNPGFVTIVGSASGKIDLDMYIDRDSQSTPGTVFTCDVQIENGNMITGQAKME